MDEGAGDTAELLQLLCQSEMVSFNPGKEVQPPKFEQRPKELYTEDGVIQILRACEELGNGPHERKRARAMLLLLRYTGLHISDVATLSRDRVRDGRVYLYTMKNGKPVFLPISDFLQEALDSLPTPKGTQGTSKYFFWSGNGTTRAFLRDVTRTMARVFKHSGVKGAYAHRFRHTLATALLKKGWTTEDVALVLGSTPDIIRRPLRTMDNSAEAWRRACGMSDFFQARKSCL